MKRIHLISNAHLDPVWQWEWEEGAATAVSTFRCAADFCDEFGDYVFCHNEALLYRWIEEYEPALFERIQQLVKAGKWHIMGGWHLQPDCNMPSGESFVRQALSGRIYFKEKFDKVPTTAINFDPFGHTRGLVQILAKSGYDSYLFYRPGLRDLALPDEAFTWVGYDGSRVMGRRVLESYGSALGGAANKIRTIAGQDRELNICLWGVGDHGGGASRGDLRNIAELKKELEKDGIEIFHSTPEEYFAELKASGSLPEHMGDLNSWAVGCYTSQVRVKQKHRLLEGMLWSTERMCSHAESALGIAYPKADLDEVQYDLLTAEFHDALPGTCIQPVEETILRQLDHGLEILSRIRARMFFALAGGQRAAASDEIPVLAYNPHPYPVEGDFACEFMLWDQNWKDEFTMPTVYLNGEKIPSQCEKEYSNLTLDWRKRVVFHAVLPPMTMSRFDCKVEVLPKKPTPAMPSSTDRFIFDGAGLHAEISRLTGLVEELSVNGKKLTEKGAFSLDVYADNEDPWGMLVDGYREKIGQFTLLTTEESTRFSNVMSPLPAVRVIEDGPVRTVVQAVFGYNSSRAVVDYKLGKCDGSLELGIRVIWDEKAKMIKMRVPTAFENMQAYGEVAFGEEPMKTEGKENVSQKYIVLHDGENALGIINDGVYGSSLEANDLCVTLLRSAGYTAHPIQNRPLLPQDRHSAYIEQGERLFGFTVIGGAASDVAAGVPRKADVYNEKPMVLSFFPSGGGVLPKSGMEITGNDVVRAVTIKKSEDKKAKIVRLFNPSAEVQTAKLTLDGACADLTFGAYEVKTLRLEGCAFTECGMCENII